MSSIEVICSAIIVAMAASLIIKDITRLRVVHLLTCLFVVVVSLLAGSVTLSVLSAATAAATAFTLIKAHHIKRKMQNAAAVKLNSV